MCYGNVIAVQFWMRYGKEIPLLYYSGVRSIGSFEVYFLMVGGGLLGWVCSLFSMGDKICFE